MLQHSKISGAHRGAGRQGLQGRQRALPCRASLREQQRPPPAPGADAEPCSSRRELLRAGAAAAACVLTAMPAAPAAAEPNPIAVFWQGRQRQNGGIKLLAPLRAAQRRLQEAIDLLAGASGDASAPVADAVIKSALQTVRASSLNCYVFEAMEDDTIETKASLFTQKFVTSADPCTFRIVLKTVTSFSPPAIKEEAEAKLSSLVLSYQKVDSYLEMAREGNPDTLGKAREQLAVTLATAQDIEALVIRVLGV